MLAKVASSESPHGKRRASLPRAARSHSTVVGSRPPACRQKAAASCDGDEDHREVATARHVPGVVPVGGELARTAGGTDRALAR